MVAAKSKKQSRSEPSPKRDRIKNKTLTAARKIATRRKLFLERRPHRSFVRTRRRDYVRSLAMPGYWSFTNEVRSILWKHRMLFAGIVGVYILLNSLLVGVSSQSTYSELSAALTESGQDLFAGSWGELSKAGLLLASSVGGALVPRLTESQQIYGIFTLLLLWLTTVWSLRVVFANKSIRLRDALYNAGSPIVSTAIVLFILSIQLLPLALAFIGLNAGISTGFLQSGGLLSMLIVLVILLLLVLSLYWVTSTIIALVVVTLPGMYPMQAIRTAGDLVIGRRTRVLTRLAWVLLLALIAWLIVILPIIFFDSWIKSSVNGIDWIPFVPAAVTIFGPIATLFIAAYVYMLYRKVVEDDTDPA